MVFIINPNINKERIEHFISGWEQKGFSTILSIGTEHTAVCLIGNTVLLKRGLANTIDEFLMSAEYIVSSGNDQVILCERGIRTFETMTRNTLDLSAVVLLKQKTHLPVIADPSHASGIRSLVPPLAKAALAVGADGIMIETHNNPQLALCDGAQSLDLGQFDYLMDELKIRTAIEKKKPCLYAVLQSIDG